MRRLPFSRKGYISRCPKIIGRDAHVKIVSVFLGYTLAHNGNSIQEVNEIMDAVSKLGAVITDPPLKRHWGGYSGYFQDPDGYLWEVAYNPYLTV